MTQQPLNIDLISRCSYSINRGDGGGGERVADVSDKRCRKLKNMTIILTKITCEYSCHEAEYPS